MELSFHETPLRYLQETVCDTVYQEETTEVIVPDSMPDVGRIVDCSAQLLLRSKDIAGGIAVTGGIQACVLYVPENEETLYRMEAYLPFTVKKNAEDNSSDVTWQGWLRSIDARMLNSRKVMVRANLGSRICIYAPREEQLAQPDETPPVLQLQQNTYPMHLLLCCGEKDLQLDEELNLPEDAAGIDRLFKTQLYTEITESKLVGSKAVFKGDAHLHILYGSADGALHSWHGQVPFSQYAQMPCEADNGEVDIRMAVTEAEIETDGQLDSHRLLLRLRLLAQVCVIGEVPVCLTEDAYALTGGFEPQWQSFCLRARLDSQKTVQTGTLSVAAQAERLVDAQVLLDLPTIRRDQENLWVSAAANASVLYYDNEHKLQGKNVRGEISCATKLADDGSCCAQVKPSGDVSGSIEAETIALNCPVEFRMDTYSGCQWQNLCGGTLTEASQKVRRPSVVVCRAGTESLWSIAKQNRTTVASIREANNLTGEAMQEGGVLLIPLKS